MQKKKLVHSVLQLSWQFCALMMFLLQPVPTCPVGHPLKLGTALEEEDRYGRYNSCFLCLVSIEQSNNNPNNLKARIECTLQCKLIPDTGLSSWRCEKDRREGNGECLFDVCEDCWEKHGVGKCHFQNGKYELLIVFRWITLPLGPCFRSWLG